MSKYTITPWRTPADLLQVRQQLYNLNTTTPDPSDDHRRHAVDRVMAWKQRGSNLPHAVESTALLVDAILHHTNTNTSSTSTALTSATNSSFSIRAVYTAAFTRFVTGFCDIGRAKERSLEPSSMLAIAKQIGMPAEFVALRHEATHEELPGLRRLVSATRQGLDWLWRVYWSRLDENVGGGESEVERVREEARSLLRGFRSSRRLAFKKGRQESQAHREEMGNVKSSCVKLCAGSRGRLEAFAGVLVEDAVLVPSGRTMGSSMEGAFIMWDEFLSGLQANQTGLLSVLVKGMLAKLGAGTGVRPDEDTGKEAVWCWVMHLLNSGTGIGSAATVRKLRQVAMKWYCLHPGYWAQRLAEGLLEGGSEEFEGEWRDMYEASKMDLADLANGSAMVVDKPEDSTAKEEEEVVEISKGWVRAVMPMSTPIGVV